MKPKAKAHRSRTPWWTLPVADAPPALRALIAESSLGVGSLDGRGDLVVALDRPRVAVIGTRRPGPGSLLAIEALTHALVLRDATIVSGAAQGTDMAAHRVALASGGRTIACLPFGIGLVDTPDGRPQLSTPPSEGLVLLSMFPSSARPTRSAPVVRNRLIAALAEAVVAGEAAIDSGTMHCVRFALELRRPVFMLRPTSHDGEHVDRARLRTLEAAGVRIFTDRDAGGPQLPDAILAAARTCRDSLARERAAQGDLFGHS